LTQCVAALAILAVVPSAPSSTSVKFFAHLPVAKGVLVAVFAVVGTHNLIPDADAPLATTPNRATARHTATTTPQRALNVLMIYLHSVMLRARLSVAHEKDGSRSCIAVWCFEMMNRRGFVTYLRHGMASVVAVPLPRTLAPLQFASRTYQNPLAGGRQRYAGGIAPADPTELAWVVACASRHGPPLGALVLS
jgi:hypothetical protein